MNKKNKMISSSPLDITYRLRGKRAFKCTIMELAKWESNNPNARRVALTKIGDIKISTIFLCLNCTFWLKRPTLFETMIFGGKLDHAMMRYSTWAQAEAGHKEMVKKVKGTLNGRRKKALDL